MRGSLTGGFGESADHWSADSESPRIIDQRVRRVRGQMLEGPANTIEIVTDSQSIDWRIWRVRGPLIGGFGESADH